MECRLIAKDIYSRIAEVRVQNKPTILLSPPVSYDGLVNRRACRVILRTYTAWTFLDGDFISSGAELSKATITKKPCLLRDSRPNPVFVNPHSTDSLNPSFPGALPVVMKFLFIRVCGTGVLHLSLPAFLL